MVGSAVMAGSKCTRTSEGGGNVTAGVDELTGGGRRGGGRGHPDPAGGTECACGAVGGRRRLRAGDRPHRVRRAGRRTAERRADPGCVSWIVRRYMNIKVDTQI